MTPGTTAAQRYRENWQDEIDSAHLYATLADIEGQSPLAEVYHRLATVETGHAAFWEDRMRAAGQTAPPRRPTWRPRTLAWLARRFGPSFILPTLSGLEQVGSQHYDRQTETRGTTLPRDEKSHARLLKTITGSLAGGLEGGNVAQLEGRHRTAGGNALRAAVLGANDGLVSNLSLVMGVAGAELAGQGILITGLAGLLAGAASMALGEWLSVQSSRELYQRQIAIEERELTQSPEEEEAELALIYQAKGLSPDQAHQVAAQIVSNPTTALDTLAREELGVDPEELGGSAWEAAATSFFLFALGAIIPVLPFAFLSGLRAIGVSVLLSALGLFVIGAGITLMTGRSLLFSGARQVLFGLAAAALTFGIGRLIGVSIGG
ncbi:MAG: VIT1/CCC1 transporter family protein [Anaerolineae bacterium]|nr:VIT1/CCC1 transporter family protein [Anaerolineae bacterium]